MMTEKDFLEAFIGFLHIEISDEEFNYNLEQFLDYHHQFYHEVAFIDKDEEDDE